MSGETSGEVVDFAYLEDFAAGDMGVVLEVLALFRSQAESWSTTLEGPHDHLRDVAHTIKGAARGVGARKLGDVADRAEFGGPAEIPALKAALDEAVAEIAAYQARKG